MEKVCRDCGTVGEPETVTKGSLAIEVVAWLCFLIPGVIYSIWRHTSRHDGCRACGSSALIPLDTPQGAALSQGHRPKVEAPRPPRPAAIRAGSGRALGRLFAQKR